MTWGLSHLTHTDSPIARSKYFANPCYFSFRMIHVISAGSTWDTAMRVAAGSPSLDEADAFRLAHRQRAGVSPVIRLKTVEKCAWVQKPTVSATSARTVSEFDSSDFARSMR